MAPPLYGGGYARMYVRGASFCILHFEWHRPCMGVGMPGWMSVARHSTSYAMSASFHPGKDALNGTAPVWGWLCPDVCPWRAVQCHTRHSSSVGMSYPGSYSMVPFGLKDTAFRGCCSH